MAGKLITMGKVKQILQLSEQGNFSKRNFQAP